VEDEVRCKAIPESPQLRAVNSPFLDDARLPLNSKISRRRVVREAVRTQADVDRALGEACSCVFRMFERELDQPELVVSTRQPLRCVRDALASESFASKRARNADAPKRNTPVAAAKRIEADRAQIEMTEKTGLIHS
jgi:hypothetical protein